VRRRSIEDLRCVRVHDPDRRRRPEGARLRAARRGRPHGRPHRPSRAWPGGALVLPRPLVTVLQRRAGGSAAGPAGDHRRRRHAGRGLAPGARTPRETDEPKAMDFALLRDFGNRVPRPTVWSSRCPTTCARSISSSASTWRGGNGDGTWRLPVPARFVDRPWRCDPRRRRRSRLHATGRSRRPPSRS